MLDFFVCDGEELMASSERPRRFRCSVSTPGPCSAVAPLEQATVHVAQAHIIEHTARASERLALCLCLFRNLYTCNEDSGPSRDITVGPFLCSGLQVCDDSSFCRCFSCQFWKRSHVCAQRCSPPCGENGSAFHNPGLS